ncbi:MAG: hypothetical protein A2140_03150 [Candidatus Muproteobacteria bacterium RBG_16_62_13]|uniref:DUF4013 domain-containing protein n=1 Tax=Candidatus Muproteobacteria bacterium RBG_16_62_13 TaxID=1817756 RepID=A0A1F6T4H1_9PROT|nr:MAG: hypothetical protein A2140_03150 [Candidatus Muproteobacteria bacterium RBG_16_62_13]
MGLLYILLALLLKRIPFLGNFMLVLITPIPVAGVWLTARQLTGVTHVPTPGPGWPERLRFYLGRPARALVEGFRREVHALPLVMICIITLGLVIIVSIVELVLTGGSMVSGLKAARLDSDFGVWRAIGLLLSLGLYTLLAMALIFVVPLVILNDRLVIPAIPESFQLCARHASALGIFLAPFLLPVIVIELTFSNSFIAPLGYLLVLTVGVVAIPLFLTGCYTCYRELVAGKP